MAADESAPAAVVTAAEITRSPGVTRAAVSNRRRRRPVCPLFTAGAAASPQADGFGGWTSALAYDGPAQGALLPPAAGVSSGKSESHEEQQK
ncbi:hypothetical protein [Streptomyces sp. MNU89]|uniref:hypothetical protein n=1 Tax=Streptomyces sp. MNU89 TaxID=2560025 RepID=UPI001E3EE44D|nr:hypothetical protein [Streptomyces sp. MNU89]MCC9738666.1 hypothetical protein [Streptomyces sp. MNU89]